jgi:hypothetical protein
VNNFISIARMALPTPNSVALGRKSPSRAAHFRPYLRPEEGKIIPVKRLCGRCRVKIRDTAEISDVRIKRRELKSLVSFRSALSRSLQGSTRPRIDHKSWWLPDWCAGNPLRDLDGAARIHVFGNARRTEAVATNSFQDTLGSIDKCSVSCAILGPV